MVQEKFQFSYTVYIEGFLNAFSPQNRCVRGSESEKLQRDFMRAAKTLYFCNTAAKHFENHRRTYRADSSVSLYILINYEVSNLISAI
jgi:hypothetical protein